MRKPPNLELDDFRNDEGDLFGSVPAQGWVKPQSVILHSKTIRNTLEGTLPYGSELEFAVPWSADSSKAIKPSRRILEDFLSLAGKSEAEMHRFASRFGPLLIYSRIEERDEGALIFESCDVWRHFAASMRALLRIAGDLHFGRPCSSPHWEAIGYVPPLVLVKKAIEIDWINPSAADGEKQWGVMAAASGQRRNQHPTLWAGFLNALLLLGRVRPWVVLDGPLGAQRPRLSFTGSNLLSYLALQVCLLASKHDAFAVCSHCNITFTPGKRAPKLGQRTFCQACRADGIPVRLAQRDRRARLQRGK
jgi:hypothetical protein